MNSTYSLQGGRLDRYWDNTQVQQAPWFRASGGFTEGYGLHWELFSGPPDQGGLPAFGHGGSDGTFAVAYPDIDAMILFFTQSRGAVEPWREALERLPILVGRDTRLR
jgi:CubicO group peptidase (beta-lactamase class C family)